jgi:hypothetical protein
MNGYIDVKVPPWSPSNIVLKALTASPVLHSLSARAVLVVGGRSATKTGDALTAAGCR